MYYILDRSEKTFHGPYETLMTAAIIQRLFDMKYLISLS